jgi:Ca-activated chloride channel family protein
MFHFHFPWASLLLLLPFLVRWLFPVSLKEEDAQAPEIHFPGLDRLKKAFPPNSTSTKPKAFFFWPLFCVWSLLVLALMQPEKVDQYRHEISNGYDLMLGVDISGSMQALDFSTVSKVVSRLDVTKDVVGKFVQGRQGDRVGLIVFGEHAYLHVPLTLDTLSIAKMLNDTVSGMAGNATALGDAIGLSVRTLKTRPEGSRVLILLTDGEDNASRIPPLEAAKIAKQYNIRIYTVGIGKNGPVPFPNGYGGYGMVEAPLDEKTLKAVAEITGGSYFRAKDENTLASIYETIDTLEKTEANETVFYLRSPFYYYPLGLAMILLLLLSLYQIYRRHSVV